MKQRQWHSLCNFAYFGLAAATTGCMVYRAWFYGFFFSPFPAILSALFLLFLGGAIISGIDIFIPVSWLGWHMPDLSKAGIVRWLALAIPLPIAAYLGLQANVISHTSVNPESIEKTRLIMQIDNVLFGHRRAEGWMLWMARKAIAEDRLQVAESFLKENLASVKKHYTSRRRIASATIKLCQLEMVMGRFEQVQSDLMECMDAYPASIQNRYWELSPSPKDCNLEGFFELECALACNYAAWGCPCTAESIFAKVQAYVQQAEFLKDVANPADHPVVLPTGYYWEMLSMVPESKLASLPERLQRERSADYWNKHSWLTLASGRLVQTGAYPGMCESWMILKQDDYLKLISALDQQ